MADKKISALTSASTPLAGTEVLPIVQSGSTVKVAVSDLTAGRAVSTGTLSVAGSATVVTSGGLSRISIGNTAASTYSSLLLYGGSGKYNWSLATQFNLDNTFEITPSTAAGGTTFNTPAVTINATTSDVSFKVGNLIQGTAAKGVNFTANTPAAGMTSQLLNWYEEGTWTPAQGSGLTVVGAFSSSGTYTRIGRQVTVSGRVAGATSVALGAGGLLTNNLPFATGSSGTGAAVDSTATKTSALIAYAGGSVQVYSAEATTASPFVDFSLTYFV